MPAIYKGDHFKHEYAHPNITVINFPLQTIIWRIKMAHFHNFQSTKDTWLRVMGNQKL